MSLSEMPAGPRYLKLRFSDEEISVIRAACDAVALRERYLMMEKAADADLETASDQAKKASDAEMAEGLASLLKADQEILIEPEDLVLVLASLKSYGQSEPAERSPVVKSIIEKIESYSRD